LAPYGGAAIHGFKLSEIALDKLTDLARALESEPFGKADVAHARLSVAIDHENLGNTLPSPGTSLSSPTAANEGISPQARGRWPMRSCSPIRKRADAARKLFTQ
jgi:hypothetical protein